LPRRCHQIAATATVNGLVGTEMTKDVLSPIALQVHNLNYLGKLERAKGFEPSTPTLARRPTDFSQVRST